MAVMVAPEIAAQNLERESEIFVSKSEARRIERQLLVSPPHRTVNQSLRKICFMLHALAQKHVSKTAGAFEDYSTFVHCTKLLQDMGLKPEISSQMDAAVSSVGTDVIKSSFEYRQLRNKMIAGLAVIADLTERPAAAGSQEYQRGVREGYRRASDIAATFLEDIDGEV
jgi:hypothetical protein